MIGAVSTFGDAFPACLLRGDGKEITTGVGNNIISDGDGGSVVRSGRREVANRSSLRTGVTGAARAVVICASRVSLTGFFGSGRPGLASITGSGRKDSTELTLTAASSVELVGFSSPTGCFELTILVGSTCDSRSGLGSFGGGTGGSETAVVIRAGAGSVVGRSLDKTPAVISQRRNNGFGGRIAGRLSPSLRVIKRR